MSFPYVLLALLGAAIIYWGVTQIAGDGQGAVGKIIGTKPTAG